MLLSKNLDIQSEPYHLSTKLILTSDVYVVVMVTASQPREVDLTWARTPMVRARNFSRWPSEHEINQLSLRPHIPHRSHV